MGIRDTEFTPPQRTKISAMSKYAKPAHKQSARMLGYALTCGAEAVWWQFAALIGIILSREELAALAFMTLMSLDYDDAVIVADAALDGAPEAGEA